MKVKPIHVALGAVAAGTGIYLLTRKETSTRKPNCANVKTKGGELDGVKYIEHVTGGASPDDALPMLIVFHPLTATPQGTAAFKSLPPTRVIRPYGDYKRGSGYSWFEKTAKGDQAALAQAFMKTATKAVPFVRDIALCRPTTGKPVVTGSSQGGHMAYLLASRAAPHVRGAVAVAGWLPQELWVRGGMAPTVGIHGTRDTIVPYSRTEGMAKVLGFPFYPFDAAHEVTSAMSKKWIAEVKSMLGHANV